MAQITSRKEFNGWFTGKPDDFAQVIAARTALRVQPYAFVKRIPDEWVAKHSLVLFRAMAISWNACNFPAHDMGRAAAAAADATFLAANAANGAANAAFVAASAARAASAAHTAAYAMLAPPRAIAAAVTAAAVGHAAAAADYAAVYHADAVWDNIIHDYEWLANEEDRGTAARILTGEILWPAGEPDGWAEEWVAANGRLAALDQGYSVWADWYNRRIEGHDTAFDIPGDTDRTHDKAILARLAAATDDDFWGNGATYVNTTLQSWIDEARERVALPNFDVFSARASAGVMPDFGTDEALNRRADLEQKIAALNDELARLDPAPAPIGHNRPPLDLDDVEIDDIPVLIQEVRVQTAVLADEIKPSQPDLQKTLETVSRLRAIGGWLAKKADLFVDKAVEKAGELTGTGIVAVLLLQLPQIQSALVAVLKSAEKWLQAGLSIL